MLFRRLRPVGSLGSEQRLFRAIHAALALLGVGHLAKNLALPGNQLTSGAWRA